MNGINEAAFRAINGLAGRWPLLDTIMTWSAHDLLFAIGVLILAAWLVNRHIGRPLLVRAGLAVVISMAVVYLVHHWYVSPRPFVALADVHQLMSHPPDTSFPSEHVTATAAATGPFLWGRARLGGLLLVATLLLAFARVFVGIHWPADVLVGVALGLAVSFGLSCIWTPFDPIEAWVIRRLPAWL